MSWGIQEQPCTNGILFETPLSLMDLLVTKPW